MRNAHFSFRSSHFVVWSLSALLVTMVGCNSSSNPVAPKVDGVAPTVNSTNPVNGTVGGAVITATFSEAMNASTITMGTFMVRGPGATPVTGTVAYSASTDIARFTPTNALASGTAYTATITTGAKDVAGNALAVSHVWAFTTAASAGDQVAPPPVGASDGLHTLRR